MRGFASSLELKHANFTCRTMVAVIINLQAILTLKKRSCICICRLGAAEIALLILLHLCEGPAEKLT